MPGPKLVVDNAQNDEQLMRKAIRKLKKEKPNHTYDDVVAEVARLKQEPQNNGS